MKIGILTFHRAHNYGAVLQCYALQEVLKSIGHDVEVIDYRQPFIEYVYKILRWDIILDLLKHPFAFRKDIKQKRHRKANFISFRANYLHLSAICNSNDIPKYFDAYVIGSDQLWGVDCLGGRLDPVYFGNFSHSEGSNIIGYAISTNERSINSVDKQQLTNFIKNFYTLSFREQSMSNLVYTITGVSTHVDLDPTLLLKKEMWNFHTSTEWRKRNYVLVYYVHRKIGKYAHLNLLEKAKEIAANINAEVIDLTTLNSSVEDFVESFKYAKCVVTSSFHATVFSVIFSSPVYSVRLHDGLDERYVNLLKVLDMNSSIVEMDDALGNIPQIDFNKVNTKIEELREPSIEYLISSLK